MASKRHSIQPQVEETQPPFLLALLVKHRNKLFYVAVVLVAIGIFAGRSLTRRGAVHEHDFLQAQVNLQHLQNASEEKGSAIAQLEGVLQRHGELHAKYDGPLAQAHIISGDSAAAREVATPLLERATPSHYATFSEGSLLIAEGHLRQALDHSLALKEELRGADAPLLRAHNLLRIALLQGETGRPETERQAWEELLDDLARGGAELVFMQAFTSGSISLADYADARLRLLG